MEFKIESICSRKSGYGGEQDAVVKVTMDAKTWAKAKKSGWLGALYGVDISNEVFRITNRLVPAYNPTVDDSERASKGVKKIFLSYRIPAESIRALGIQPLSYSTTIYVPGRASLRLVVA